MTSKLNKIRSAQIIDVDHITEAELTTLDVHQNVFVTKDSSTTVKVSATSDTPVALTVQGVLCTNVADTSSLTISGSAGEKWVWAVRDTDTTVKTFTLEMTDKDGTPTSPGLSRLIATVDWDGSAVTKVKWSLSSRLQIEQQVPATDGQTVFTFNEIVYTPGREELLVFVNGQLEFSGVSYTETDSTSITFVTGVGIDTLCNLTFVKINSNNYVG